MSIFPLGGQAKSVLPWGALPNNRPAGFWEKMVVPYGLVAYQDFDIRHYNSGSYFEGEFYDLTTVASVGLFLTPHQGNAAVGPSAGVGPFSTCNIFDGTTASYTSFNTSSTGLPLGSTSRSFAFWFEVPNFTNYFVPFHYGTNSANQYQQIFIDKTGGGNGGPGTINNYIGNGAAYVHTTATIGIGAPQHCVVTMGSNLASTLFYINGVPVSTVLSGSDSTANTIQGANYHFINNSTVGGTNGGFGAGQMMELRIYNRVIDPSEVLELYAAGLAGRNTWATQYSELPILPSQGSPKQFGNIIP
jgi:hypothetical protein